jgi:uncharacterized protein (DUF58 family)
MHRLEQLDIMSRKILQGKMQGERRSKKRGQSVEFADYRNYVAGDDLRRIDWNLYARLDKLFLRLFMEEEDLSVSVLLDVSRSMDYGDPNKLRYGKQVMAALGYVGLVNYNRVHLYSFCESLVDQMANLRGKRPVPQMLDFVAALAPVEGAGSLAAACKRYALMQRNKGVVIIISDFLDKGELNASFRYLSGDRYDVYLVQLLSPQEIDPEQAGVRGDLRLEDIEDGNQAELSVGPGIMRRYKANLQAYCQHLRQQCARREMAHMISDTAIPFDTLVLRYLRERGLVG